MSIAKQRQYVNEWRSITTEDGEFVVSRIGVALTPFVVYTAWEAGDGHSTQTTTSEGVRVGAVHTRRLPAEVEEMRPGTPERIGAVAELRERHEQDARAAILAAFPELWERGDVRFDGARVETAENGGEA